MDPQAQNSVSKKAILAAWTLKFLGLETITENKRGHGGRGCAGCACADCSPCGGSFCWHGPCRPTELELGFQLFVFEF